MTTSNRPTVGVLFVLFLLLAGTATAEVNRWTSLGPLGADLQAVAVHPTEPATLFVGARGELFRSVDDGSSWQSIFSSAGVHSVIATLAIDPNAPETLYLGVTNVGIFKSFDSGQSWALLEGPTAIRCCVSALTIDPTDSSILYASNRGQLLRSLDGAATWTPIGSGLPASCCLEALVIDPQTPSTLYAGSTSSGPLFKSVDSGQTWTTVETNLEGKDIFALAIDPQQPSRLYAAVLFEGILTSSDGGMTWLSLPGLTLRAVRDLAFDALDPTAIYTATAVGLFRGTGPGSWTNLVDQGLSSTRVHTLAIDPMTPSRLYAATSSGVFKSTDGGNHWATANSGLRDTTVLSLVIDPQTPQTLYLGTVFDGVFKSTDAGLTWSPANKGRASSATILTLDPQTPATIYADGVAGQLYKSTDRGASWGQLQASPYSVDALVIHPQQPSILLAGSGQLFGGISKSIDGGISWARLETGFESTRVQALVIDPRVTTTVYAGTSLGGRNRILKSWDGGSTWSPPGDGLPFPVSTLWASPNAALYAGVRGSDAAHPGGVYKSVDGGVSWQALNRGFSALGEVTALVPHPTDSRRLYATSSANGTFELTEVPMSVGDFVWNDLDADGIQDVDEPGLGGIRLILSEVGGNLTESVTTETDGSFRFELLPPGQYTLGVSLPSKAIIPHPEPAFRFSPADQGNDDEQDSDVDPTTGTTPPFTLALGDNNRSLDVGLIALDLDGDGVDTEVEAAAPNAGDGNGDGLLDSEQAGVTSVPSATTGEYITLVTSCLNRDVRAIATNTLPPDPNVDQTPQGLLGFTLECATTEVLVIFHGLRSLAGAEYRKFGPTPQDPNLHWYTLPVDFGTLTIDGMTVATASFALADGQLGDSSTTPDGLIIDPGGPALLLLQDIPTLSASALLLLAGLLALFACRRLADSSSSYRFPSGKS